MLKKFPQLQDDLLVLFGIIFAIRLIYTKEIYIHDVIFGIKVNVIHLLILTIILVAINRSFGEHKENDEEIKHK